jgi:hypothetical protein
MRKPPPEIVIMKFPMRYRAVKPPFAAILLLACLAGCTLDSSYQASWDGRRGYGGDGDYGYDINASRAEAGAYQAQADASYATPGPPDDPWGPYIQEAASRFQVPERWIRAIMRQESGGRLYDASGRPITSPVGAMGLMQVMPRTYDTLRSRYALGSDPYDPRDNIQAGAAYIREMHARYGAPGFVAAYNAGPDRVEGYLSGAKILPDETIHYLANVVPRLGQEVAMSGPMAGYAVESAAPSLAWADGAYAGGGMTGGSAAWQAGAGGIDDPSLRAFDGGGLVTAGAPTGMPR